MAPRVAVIGGGPAGLMCVKNFREDGFDATLYESRDWVGGLWKYSRDAGLSVTQNTIFNTSKYRGAVTDFPMPDDIDEFPKADQLYRYWNDYCTHFQLWPHIKLKKKVLAVRREDDRWALDIADVRTSENVDTLDPAKTEYFDKVCVATGPFARPKYAKLEGLEHFAGEQLHGMNLHDHAKYKDQNVLIVGLHASASDAACGLAGHAKKIWLAHRSGVTMVPRYAPDGSVYDRMPPFWFTILTVYLHAWLPGVLWWLMDTMMGSMSKKAYPNMPKSWNMQNAPSIAVTTPLIAEELYPLFQSGVCEPTHAVKRILGPRSIELTDGRILSNIDTIIFCTGYDFYIPLKFDPPELNPYPVPGEVGYMYRNMFSLHPDQKIRDSLAFQSQAAVFYPGFSQFEIQIMAISQIWKGNSSLPPYAEMKQWHHDFIEWREHTKKAYKAKDTFYPAILPYSDSAVWLDKTAGLGIRENLGWMGRWKSKQAWEMWWYEPKLYRTVLSGFSSSAILRLFETGKRKRWSGARQAILTEDKRVEWSRRMRVEMMGKGKGKGL